MKIKHLVKLAAVAVVCTSLFGCVGYGNASASDQQKVDAIKVNKTTKADVQRILGKPGEVAFAPDNGDEIWTYQHVSTNALAYIPFAMMFKKGIDEDNVTIRFNSKGVVKVVGQGKAL